MNNIAYKQHMSKLQRVATIVDDQLEYVDVMNKHLLNTKKFIEKYTMEQERYIMPPPAPEKSFEMDLIKDNIVISNFLYYHSNKNKSKTLEDIDSLLLKQHRILNIPSVYNNILQEVIIKNSFDHEEIKFATNYLLRGILDAITVEFENKNSHLSL